MGFRDDREAQRARIAALEADLAAAEARATDAARERDAAIAELDRVRDEDDAKAVLNEAVEERQRERERLEREEEAAKRRLLRRTSGTRERLAVVWNLRRTHHIVVSVFALLGGLTIIATASALSNPHILAGERATMLWMLSVGVVTAVVSTAIFVTSVGPLLRFREKLPFSIDSAEWAALVDQEFFWIQEFWWHVVVSVEGGAREQVHGALTKLCRSANRTFYTAEEPSRDERLSWNAKGRKARGSANRNTAYVFARWCQRELAQVPGVERVSLSVEHRPIHVSAPSSD